MAKVIILGAKGRFGRATATAFLEAGWDVTLFGRNWAKASTQGTKRVTGDAYDSAALTAACTGQDVIVHALHPPYENWARDKPKLTANVIAAAQDSGATVIVPGNVYNYGEGAPACLTETTEWTPTTRKGKLRVDMEESFRRSGVRTIVLRSGDFLERTKTGSWFDAQIAVKAHQGHSMYPGPLDCIHAWAYLPDVGRAAVALAEERAQLETFAQFGFPGYTLTGAELVDHIKEATGKIQKISSLPWFLIPLIGLFQPTIREIFELRYLWRIPHRIDGTKLAKALPDFRPTPLRSAMKDVLSA